MHGHLNQRCIYKYSVYMDVYSLHIALESVREDSTIKECPPS